MKVYHSLAFPIFLGLAFLLLLGVLWRLHKPHVNSYAHKATNEVTISNNEPRQIHNLGKNQFIWSLRSPVSKTVLNPMLAEAVQFIEYAPILAEKTLARQNMANIAHKKFVPLLKQDGANAPLLLAAQPANGADALDYHGRPLRWVIPENIIAGLSLPRPVVFKTFNSSPIPAQFAKALAKLRPAGNAGSYRALVESYTRKYNLNTELVMAIIHSESNFQPALVSPRSAMGLMQLLPSTASGEVHRFLYGKRGQVTFEQLAVPEINVSYGTAYLHILFNRYFANIRDSHVREACVIASYNLGPNRFLRLYGNTNEAAISAINRMEPNDFHADLPKRLPARETRFYVEKVKRMKEQYKNMFP